MRIETGQDAVSWHLRLAKDSQHLNWLVISQRVTYNGSQAFLTMHADGDKNIQIVPHGQCSALVNQLPLQTSWQPSIQFERVVLQKRPEEQRMQDVVV